MTMAAATKGWCPGALRPMESGDGLIVRLKITGGIVPVRLAAEIACWSERWGNGQIDLTARANLQLRGIAPASLPSLRDAMAARSLLDSSPEAEAVRNVIASPLAGLDLEAALDPEAALDIGPLVVELERRLAADPALHALPPKFGFAIDDGGGLGLAGAPADIRFEARRTGAGAVFDIALDGAPAHRLGPVAADVMPEAASRLGRAFIAATRLSPDIRRMRDWVRLAGLDAVADGLGLAVEGCCAARVTPASTYLGRHGAGAQAFIGIALPFGRVAARDLAALAVEIERLGGHEVRLTPWRTLIVPLPSSTLNASALEGRGEPAFILRADDPLLRVAACVGAPACPRATTDVRADAARLAATIPNTSTLHVSGCAKGCAHPKPAAITLVGRDGRYDLIRDGAPSDRPMATDLTLAQAERMIALEDIHA